MNKQYHSVRLEKDRCKGCTNCLKRCPTEAIRVREGRARIIDERCIDCGECIRVCPYHAKVAETDPLSAISRFPYKIALPAPSLYGQFKNLQSADQVLHGLRMMGFDAVFEVARGADIVSRAVQEYIKNPDLPKPLISGACPAIVRLIQVRFPELLGHILPIRQPMEVAATVARSEFSEAMKVPETDIGCFFITPCPAKMTAIRKPLGQEKSAMDGAISMLEVYGLLSSHARTPLDKTQRLGNATQLGVGWANSGGETLAISVENSLAVDGIENVIRVLEEIENNKLSDLTFFEGLACTGGCVGGPLVFENSYVAKNAIRKLTERMPPRKLEEAVDPAILTRYPIALLEPIAPNPVMKLDDNLVEAIKKMERLEKIAADLPGFDCGSCGSPTCRTLAEDIVRGYATEMDCIHKLKERLRDMAEQMVDLAVAKRK